MLKEDIPTKYTGIPPIRVNPDVAIVLLLFNLGASQNSGRTRKCLATSAKSMRK